MGVSSLDLIIIFVYMTSMLGLGVFLFRREGSEGFFVNNRNTKTILLLFTALSTSVGAGTVIGMASAAYTTGISLGIMYAIISLIGWTVVALFSPRIKKWADKAKAFTLGDFFKSRYSNETKTVGSTVILTSGLILAAIQFIAFARLTEVIGGLNFELSLILAAAITITYTVLAGIKGDFYTDAIQFFVILPVFIFLFITAFSKVGFIELFNSVPKDFLNPFNYAGPFLFFAALLFGIPLLLVNMSVWQRIFAATDDKTARRAFLLSGVLKVVFILASILLGLLAFHFFSDIEADSSIFILMREFLPSGLLGLGFASVLAIIMSTIDSTLMVGSATITKDFYLHKNPDADEKKKLFVGRFSVLIFGAIALIIALSFQDIVKLIIIGIQGPLVLAPAIIGGLFWKRSNKKAAFWSILVGFITILIVMPFSLTAAFVPGVLISIVIFVVLSLRAKGSQETTTENAYISKL